MDRISDHRIAPAGTIQQIGKQYLDDELDFDQTSQSVEVLADHSDPVAAIKKAACARCETTSCPSLKGGICHLPDLGPKAQKVLAQLKSGH